ncbi:MAG: peptide/nickel transport system substrate-binding protein [Chloroflexota bacterium]|nr:peptide/nickel transport system substrate-binding protein [Chloroflexota bacterium]
MLLLLAACASPAPQAAPTAGSDTALRASARKSITIAIRGDPKTLSARLNSQAGAGGVPGVEEIEQMLNAGLTFEERGGTFHTQLAEAVPSIENGLWKVFPDGRMETTWHIRPGAQWHDGTPFTAADVIFTALVQQDKDVPIFRDVAYGSIDTVEAPDPLTVVISWRRPYVEADGMFTSRRGLPLPRHLLEQTWLQDKTNLPNQSYWFRDFIGTGPYRLRELLPGSHALLDANDQFVLGRPKIDSIEVKFIPDPSAIGANILAGQVDTTLGGRLSLEWATGVRDQWRDGKLALGAARSAINLYPQFIDPSPAILADVQFRRALLMAIDRQQIVDTIAAGVAPIAHGTISQYDADWSKVEPSMAKYPYDAPQAAQILTSLGYSRAPDGMLQDRNGQQLRLEIRSTANDDAQIKSMAAIATMWQQVGIVTDQVAVPEQAASDRQYRATRPAFEIVRQPGGWRELRRIYGGDTPLPQNNYTGQNRSRYQGPELDSLIDQFFTTIPEQQRVDILGRIERIVTDQLTILGIYWDPDPVLVSNRLSNVQKAGEVWDIHTWEAS